MKPRQRSSATPLAWAMAAVVLYASLYPFSGWRWPAGSGPLALLTLHWPPWLLPLDEWLNFAGYLPLGLLSCVAALRSGWRLRNAVLLAVLGPALMSYTVEVLQHLLPGRHPSLKDLALNSLGALAGASLGAIVNQLGWLQRLQRQRQRWFEGHSAGALALLALWPLGLLFPAPLPWGLGQVGERLRETVLAWLDGVAWADDWALALAEPAALVPLGALAERVTSMLGLMAPVLLAYSISPPGWHRLLLAAGALALGFVAMTISTLLNFGPGHALAWLTPVAVAALVGAATASVALAALGRRVVQALALMALAASVALISQAPTDPYFAQNLQAWEQGRWVRFHGLAQWIGWLWPFAVITWLLVRLSRRQSPGQDS